MPLTSWVVFFPEDALYLLNDLWDPVSAPPVSLHACLSVRTPTYLCDEKLGTLRLSKVAVNYQLDH